MERLGILASHFDDLEQQREASRLGMWIFLGTEIMFFGGLFLTYTVYRFTYADAFADASAHLDLMLGAINTIVLITSSLTMALSVYGAECGRRKAVVGFLFTTIALGTIFLGIKAIEYGHKFSEHFVPGSRFAYPEATYSQHAELFFSLYFAMTGMHALHMIIGVGVLFVLVFQAWKGKFSPVYYAPVELTGLYWHFVDIIWIFLFPLLYLIRGR
jgi:cytochrome c oxidase subunit 3